MDATSPVRGSQPTLTAPFIFTALAVTTATITAIARLIFSASLVVISGGIAATTILTSSAITFLVIRYLQSKPEISVSKGQTTPFAVAAPSSTTPSSPKKPNATPASKTAAHPVPKEPPTIVAEPSPASDPAPLPIERPSAATSNSETVTQLVPEPPAEITPQISPTVTSDYFISELFSSLKTATIIAPDSSLKTPPPSSSKAIATPALKTAAQPVPEEPPTIVAEPSPPSDPLPIERPSDATSNSETVTQLVPVPAPLKTPSPSFSVALDKKSESIEWVAHIDHCLESDYIGDLVGMPEYLKRIAFADGSSLSLKENDVLIRFSMTDYNPSSRSFLTLILSDDIWLPAKLFLPSNEYGDIVKFQYQGGLIALKITSNGSFHSFSTTFKNLVQSANKPLFGNPIEDYWYNLATEGSIYKFNQQGKSLLSLEKLDKSFFTPIQTYTKTNYSFNSVSQSHDQLRINFSGLDFSKLNLIINEEFIVIYGTPSLKGYFGNHLPSQLEDTKLFKFEWGPYWQFKIPLKKMKERLKNAKIILIKGYLVITF